MGMLPDIFEKPIYTGGALADATRAPQQASEPQTDLGSMLNAAFAERGRREHPTSETPKNSS